jgi:L-alanine-DL-glutamate epimerase-like enolase superfamily enzyme
VTRIVRVEVGRYDYPLVGEFKFFRGAMRPSVLVRLTDADGVQGWGQSVPVETWTYETVETVESTLVQYLAPAILGADPANLAEVHARMEKAIRPSFSVGQPLAKAAIDLACHDLWGRHANRRVADLLGGAKTDAVRLSWTVQSPTLDGAERSMEEGRAAGYRHFNIKLGPPQTAVYDLELVERVVAFAPDGFHWGDANTGYSLDVALDMAPRLADRGLRALESPLPPSAIRGYQALRALRALPILMDEGIVALAETEEFIALGMLDGIAMKVARCGGLWHASRIVAALRDSGLAVYASGLTDPDLSLAASIQLFAWAGLDLPAALNGPQFLAGRGTTDDRFRAEADVVRLPDAPGLGITLDPAAERTLRTVAQL